ncbi:hypothetical protein H0H92_005479 [Tricholoma furcatifolium]|nr:hypothetical protein H0H92_005479 [Tricholoma furcatifolium]
MLAARQILIIPIPNIDTTESVLSGTTISTSNTGLEASTTLASVTATATSDTWPYEITGTSSGGTVPILSASDATTSSPITTSTPITISTMTTVLDSTSSAITPINIQHNPSGTGNSTFSVHSPTANALPQGSEVASNATHGNLPVGTIVGAALLIVMLIILGIWWKFSKLRHRHAPPRSTKTALRTGTQVDEDLYHLRERILYLETQIRNSLAPPDYWSEYSQSVVTHVA